MANNFPAVFKKIGLNSLYIVDSSGLPILIRNYFADEYSDEKNIIITSFASAITIFAQNILVSLLFTQVTLDMISIRFHCFWNMIKK